MHGGYADNWATIGLSVMATQASAITFLSTPGQAYTDGMRFLQFYFGLPLAMVVLSIAFVPRFYGLRVVTAYEYLEARFDRKTRQLAAFLFLVQRGLSAGITIYAPAIVLSTVLGWSLGLTCVSIGALVILYTVSGGTRAVSQTQKHQMVVMLGGMAVAFVVVVMRLPPQISFGRAVGLAGTLGKMNVVDFSPRLDSRYTFWSGITGGFFLAMSYFGTDQSQVQRYLSGRSITESRLGLLFNGLFKVPMQFLILFVGVMVFVFHQFQPAPIFFNQAALDAARRSRARRRAARAGSQARGAVHAQAGGARAARGGAGSARRRRRARRGRERARGGKPDAGGAQPGARGHRIGAAARSRQRHRLHLHLVRDAEPAARPGRPAAGGDPVRRDVVDRQRADRAGRHQRRRLLPPQLPPDASDRHYLRVAQLFTAGWGVLAVLFAAFASLVDNLIQAVNILGSLFYGTILGLFLVAFFFARVGATAVFIAALLSETVVIVVWLTTGVGFLWFNVIGCAIVIAALALAGSFSRARAPQPTSMTLVPAGGAT